jgi:hypothetical protein
MFQQDGEEHYARSSRESRGTPHASTSWKPTSTPNGLTHNRSPSDRPP